MLYLEEILLQFFIIISPIIFYQMYFNDEKLFPFTWKPHRTLLILMMFSSLIVINFPIVIYDKFILDFHSLIIMYAFLYGNRRLGVFLAVFTLLIRLVDNYLWGIYEFVLFPLIYLIPILLHSRWNKLFKKMKYVWSFIMAIVSVSAHILIIYITSLINPAELTTVKLPWLLYFSLAYILFFFVIIYITEFISETIRLRRAVENSEKMMVVSELAASIAHEVRNPLTVVKGFVQLVEKDSNDSNKEYMKLVLSELDRAESIITDYLQFAKKNQQSKEIICISQLLQAVHTVMTSYTNMKGIVFQVHVKEELYIKGDLSKIKQVCFNLVKNSAEAIEHENGLINLSCSSSGNYVVIEIEDNGVGMEQAEVERIGEAFYTNKESGTGLGVMVTKSIIQDHDGFIEYTSTKNKGTKVKVMLPKYDENLVNSAKK